MAKCVNEECLKQKQCECVEPQKTPVFDIKSGSDLLSVDQSTGTTAVISDTPKLARAVEKIETFDTETTTNDIRKIKSDNLNRDEMLTLHQEAVQRLFRDKVSNIAGKGLSSNDFTNEDKAKLEDIEFNAQRNRVNSVNGLEGDVQITLTGLGFNESNFVKPNQIYSKEEINRLIDNVNTSRFKGVYRTLQEVPKPYDGNSMYLVGASEPYAIYALISDRLQKIGATNTDLSGYILKADYDREKDTFVRKENGKGLSSNDFTTALKNKLETLRMGTDGANGKSAYEVARESGFTGTKEEWLASLKGQKGDKGENGANGHDGVQGIQGVGIKNIELANNYGLRITLTNNQVFETASVRGEKGERGDNASAPTYNDTELRNKITALETGKADKTAIPTLPANILTKDNLNSEARTLSGLNIAPGNGTVSASIFLTHPQGKKYEFFSDGSGAFGVWNKTDNQNTFRVDSNNTTFYKNLNVNNLRVANVPDPAQPQDATNKRWVESQISRIPRADVNKEYVDNKYQGLAASVDANTNGVRDLKTKVDANTKKLANFNSDTIAYSFGVGWGQNINVFKIGNVVYWHTVYVGNRGTGTMNGVIPEKYRPAYETSLSITLINNYANVGNGVFKFFPNGDVQYAGTTGYNEYHGSGAYISNTL